MSPIKEPHFFCSDIRRKNFTQPHYRKFDIDIDKYLNEKPLRKMHIAYIDKLKQYEALFLAGQNKKYLGESSGGYLYSSTAARALYDYNPEAKIIISLREPVDRAYSHWKMNISNGRESEGISFSQCIDDAFNIKNKAWGVSHLYVDLGLYYEQIKRYLDVFPRENILIVFYRDLVISPQKFMDKIFEFLDVDSIAIAGNKHSNRSRKPRFPMLHDYVREHNLTRFFSGHIVERIKTLTSTDNFPVLTNQERIVVYEKYFKDDVLKLQDLLEDDLPLLTPI
jgi:hypothetical protein